MLRFLRVLLCALLLAPGVPARAQEAASEDAADDVAELTPAAMCVSAEIEAAGLEAGDEAGATEAADTEAGARATPAKISLSERRNRLYNITRLLEFFRGRDAKIDPQIKRSLAASMPPSHRRFFANRRRVLNTMYRTLAAIDYTYASKQPGQCPDGAKARHEILSSKDGLFADPKTGKFSPWLERLIGKRGGSVAVEEAAEDAAAEEAASIDPKSGLEASYSRLLTRQLKLTRDIDAEKDAKKRAGLMCRRARGYRVLAIGALLQKPQAYSDRSIKAGEELEAAADEAALTESVDAATEETAAGDQEAGDSVTDAAWTLGAAAPALSAKDVYRQISPSVVAIKSTSKSFGGTFGTGSVISGKVDGLVLTNAHVIWNKTTGKPHEAVTVFFKPARLTGDRAADLKDGVPATIVKYSRSKDLALLALGPNGRSLKPVVFGDDSKIEPGEPVYAIGHPEQGGLWTLTQGVVSAVKANLNGVKGKDAFQTDASINRGNSGGPLLDSQGRQIGVNTQIARRADDGLAITSVNFSLKIGFVKAWLDSPVTVEAADQEVSQAVDVTEDVADDAGDGSILTVARPYSLDEVVGSPIVDASDDLSAAADDAAADGSEQASADEAASKIVTEKHPYNASEVLQQQMKEMDDMGKSMSKEISKRGGLSVNAAADDAGELVAQNEVPAAVDDASENVESAAGLPPTRPAPAPRSTPPSNPAPRPNVHPPAPPPPKPQGFTPAPQQPTKWINKPPPQRPQTSINQPPRPQPTKPQGCFGPNGGIKVPTAFASSPKSPARPKHGTAGGKGAGKPFNQGTVQEALTQNPDKNCVFCGIKTTDKPGPTKTEIDHAIPKSRGGNNEITNAQVTCRDCNRKKGAKTTDEFQNSK